VAGRAEERAEGFAGERLLVLAAAGVADGSAGAVAGGAAAGAVATGVAFLRKLFPAGLGVRVLAALGNLAAGFCATEADRLGRAATAGAGVSSVL
jgi:hypothetical protein